MNPINDIVCNLLETPFCHWKENDKKDVLLQGRPTDSLTIFAQKEKHNKSYNIYFQNSWFDKYKWLCSSPTLQKLFCWPCLLFSNKHSNFSRDGLSNILHITRSFHTHTDSSEHLKSIMILRKYEKNQSILTNALEEQSKLLKDQFNEDIRLNRLFVKIAIKAVLYLSKQALAFCDENSDSINLGNFDELLALLISGCSLEIQNHCEKNKDIFSGYSEMFQNELIECISDYINDHVKTEINQTQCFSIQVDNTREINQTHQCSLIIRFVNSEGVLVERFLGFHDVNEDKTPEAVYRILGSVLEQFDYQHKLVGQCYDGASVKSEHLDELQIKVKDKATLATFAHCLEHPLNLILQQSVSNIPKCRIFFASLGEISLFFRHSAKQCNVLASMSVKGMPAITTSRWSSVSILICAIVEDWDKLKKVFEVLMNSNQSDKQTVHLAKGFLNDMNNFEFTFLTIVFNELLGYTTVLFQTLQENSLDINYCVTQIIKIRENLKNTKSYPVFRTLIEKANKITEINMAKQEYATLTKEKVFQTYKQLYFKIVDHILMEVDTRFQDYDKLKFVSLVDATKFQQFNKHFPCLTLDKLQNLYGKLFISQQRLKNELSLLYANKELWNLSIQELMRVLHEERDICSESYKLVSLILTIPSTSMSVKGSFSCIKRLQAYLRNTVPQDRLASLANIFIQNDVLSMLMQKKKFYDEIIDRFAVKEKRIELIFKT